MIVHVNLSLADETCRIFYLPNHNQIAVHGIKTIWQDLQINVPAVEADYIVCTKLLAYLLHPEWEEHQHFLGYLAEHCLGTKYPYTPASVYRANYPGVFYEILAHDSELIHSLAQELGRRMDDDLWHMYRHVELFVAAILNEMTLRKGLLVDRYACLAELEKAEKQKLELEKLMFGDGRRAELRNNQQAYQYLSPRIPINDKFSCDNGQISGFVLDELACDHEEAAWVSRWRELDAGIRFLRAALNPDNEGRIRSHWKQTVAKTSRIVARDYPVQNVKREYRRFLIPDEGHVLIK